jgi:hypothetical protein
VSHPFIIQPALQSVRRRLEAALGLGGGEVERFSVGHPCLPDVVEAAEEFGSGGVEVTVVVEVERIDDRQRRAWPFDLGDRHGPVYLGTVTAAALLIWLRS